MLLLPLLALPWTLATLRGWLPREQEAPPSRGGQALDYILLLNDLERNEGYVDVQRYRTAGLDEPALRRAAVEMALRNLDGPGWYGTDRQFLRLCAEREPAEVILQMVEHARRPGTSADRQMAILELCFQEDSTELPPGLPAPAARAVCALADELGVERKPATVLWWQFKPSLTEQVELVARERALELGNQHQMMPARIQLMLFCELADRWALTPAQDCWMRAQLDGNLSFLNGMELDPLMLLRVATRYPDTRYTRACREYALLRGGTYFGNESLAKVVHRAEDWDAWARRYPDHPGVDDARYWQVRNLEWSGRRLEALEVMADELFSVSGDQDEGWASAQRFLVLLDTGTTRQELERFNPRHALAPLVRYASAVRLAREHRYAEAFERSRGLELNRLANQALGTRFYNVDRAVASQRESWQELSRVRDPWDLARHWAAQDGWHIGYLELFRGERTTLFAWGPDWIDAPGRQVARGDREMLRRNYQLANQNAVALELVQKVLAHPPDPDTKERALYMRVALLYFQTNSFPLPESEAMHPLPGFPHASSDVDQWYEDQAIGATRQLLEEFPHSRYGDDALLVLADLTRDEKYAREAIRRFPHGDLIESVSR